MGGGSVLGMKIVTIDDNKNVERSYGFDTILTVRARNPRIAYRKEST